MNSNISKKRTETCPGVVAGPEGREGIASSGENERKGSSACLNPAKKAFQVYILKTAIALMQRLLDLSGNPHLRAELNAVTPGSIRPFGLTSHSSPKGK